MENPNCDHVDEPLADSRAHILSSRRIDTRISLSGHPRISSRWYASFDRASTKMAETMARNHSATYDADDTMTRKLNLTSMIFLPSSAAAINAETTISTNNPSTVVTAASNSVAVTTTAKAHHHVSNVTEYLVEHDEHDQSK